MPSVAATVVVAQATTTAGTSVRAAGFGFVVAVAALLVAAILARRR